MPNGYGKATSETYPLHGNRLVAALTSEDQHFFNSKSTSIELSVGQILTEPGDTVDFCYFPTKGVISLVTLMSNGAGAEVALVGTEGMLGYTSLLLDSTIPHQALVQGKGEALRITASDLQSLLQQSRNAGALMLRFINSVIAQISQSAACNALHKAESRLARWILLVQDRLHEDVLPITHEFLANMLGIRRATVTVVANVLEEAGHIALGRKEIRVLSREGLLKASCECYSAMTHAVKRVV